MSPWVYARAAGRDYITPEDIETALASGEPRDNVAGDVLWAINDSRTEDARLCAFVAVDGWKERRVA
jgi:hypothetical protein